MLNINTNTCEFFFLEYLAIIFLKFHWTCCLPLRFKWQKTLRINSTIIHMKKYQNFHQYPVNTDTYGNMLTLTFSLFHCNSRSQTGRESDVGHVIWRRCCHLAREITPLPLYGQRGREGGGEQKSFTEYNHFHFVFIDVVINQPFFFKFIHMFKCISEKN